MSVSASFVDTPWEPEGVAQPLAVDFGRGSDEQFDGLAAVDALTINGPYALPAQATRQAAASFSRASHRRSAAAAGRRRHVCAANPDAARSSRLSPAADGRRNRDVARLLSGAQCGAWLRSRRPVGDRADARELQLPVPNRTRHAGGRRPGARISHSAISISRRACRSFSGTAFRTTRC